MLHFLILFVFVSFLKLESKKVAKNNRITLGYDSGVGYGFQKYLKGKKRLKKPYFLRNKIFFPVFIITCREFETAESVAKIRSSDGFRMVRGQADVADGQLLTRDPVLVDGHARTGRTPS